MVRDISRTCVLPAIEYSSLAWSGMGKRNAQLLNRVHRHAARLISGTRLSELVSNELLLSRTGLSLLASHRNFQLAFFASRFLSELVPLHLSEVMDHWQQSVSGRALLLKRPPAVCLPRAKKKFFPRHLCF